MPKGRKSQSSPKSPTGLIRRFSRPGPKAPAQRVAGQAGKPATINEESIKNFIATLSNEERMLIVLKRELYEGSWDEMVADLKARLEGGPYIFKLASRIVDDLARITRLRQYEASAKVDLSQYVQM